MSLSSAGAVPTTLSIWTKVIYCINCLFCEDQRSHGLTDVCLQHVEVDHLADIVRWVFLVDVVVALVDVAPPGSPVYGHRQVEVFVHGTRYEVLVVNVRVLY